MYSHVLVPLSLDEGASMAAALKAATGLVSEDGRISLLHVLARIPAYAENYLPDGFEEKIQQKIEAILRDVDVDAARLDGVVRSGRVGPVVVDYAQEHGADCIVLMAAHVGDSVARPHDIVRHVVRHADCTVHLVK